MPEQRAAGRRAGQRRMVDPGDARARSQPPGEVAGTQADPLHAQRQGAQAADQEPRVERGELGAEI